MSESVELTQKLNETIIPRDTSIGMPKSVERKEANLSNSKSRTG